VSARSRTCRSAILLAAMLASGTISLASVITTGPFYVQYAEEASAAERAEVMAIVVAVSKSLPDSAVHLCPTPSRSLLHKQWRREVREALVSAGIETSRIRDNGWCDAEMAKNKPTNAVAVLVGPSSSR